MKYLYMLIRLILYPALLAIKAIRALRSPESRPDVIHLVSRVQTALAPVWRKSIRLTVVIIGICLFVFMELGLAKLVDAESWYMIFIVAVVTASLILVITKPAVAYLSWLFFSPWVALFLSDRIGALASGGLPVNFDSVMIMLLVVMLAFRCLANRHPLKKLMLPELLLIVSMLYSRVPDIVNNPVKTVSLARFLETWGLLLTPALVYFTAKGCITEKKHIRWALGVIVALGLSWALSGIYEQYAGQAWFSPFIGFKVAIQGEHDIGQGRSTGPAGHYYIYGLVLVLSGFLLYHMVGWTTNRFAKIIGYVGFAVATVGLYYGYSRAPYVAFALFTILMPLFANASRKRYLALIVALVVVSIPLVPMIWSNRQFQQRMLSDTSTPRLAIAATSLNIIREHLWLGIGYEKYQSVASDYVSSIKHPSFEDINYPTPTFSRPHNEFLLVLAEQGVVGVLLYFGAYFSFVWHMFRVRPRLAPHGLLGQDLITSFVVFVVTVLFAMMSDEFQAHPYMYYVLVTVFALVVRLGELSGDEETSQEMASTVPVAVSPHALK